MEGLKKFKLFVLLLVLCVANVFLYRFFSGAPSIMTYIGAKDQTVIRSESDTFTSGNSVISASGSSGTSDQASGQAVGQPSVKSDVSETAKPSDTGADKAVVTKKESSSGTVPHTPSNASLPSCPLVPPHLSKSNSVRF